MASLRSIGLSTPRLSRHADAIEYVVIEPVLRRVMNFAGCTIDDVVNDPIAKNQVIGYFKLHKQVERGCSIVDLERQWNPLRRSS